MEGGRYGEGTGSCTEKSDRSIWSIKQFNVPHKTLDDRVIGRVVHGTKLGPGTVLTSAEENVLCNYLSTWMKGVSL